MPQERLQKNDGHVWYIPHHGVYHKHNEVQSCVWLFHIIQRQISQWRTTSSPDLANPLLGILLRFRQEQIAIMADIEAMYYEVREHEEHRDFLRFLWWPQAEVTQPLEVYHMNIHLFGAVSFPGIADFALQQTGKDNSDRFSMDVLDTIKQSFYVYDVSSWCLLLSRQSSLIRTSGKHVPKEALLSPNG